MEDVLSDYTLLKGGEGRGVGVIFWMFEIFVIHLTKKCFVLTHFFYLGGSLPGTWTSQSVRSKSGSRTGSGFIPATFLH